MPGSFVCKTQWGLAGETYGGEVNLNAILMLIGGVIGGTIAGPAGAAVDSRIGSTAGNVVEGVGGAVKELFGK